MARYIDADMACRYLTKARLIGDSRPMKEIFSEIPTADVVKYVHAEWITIKGMNSKCSACDGYFPVSEFKQRPFDIKFCPNCGAKMNGQFKELN